MAPYGGVYITHMRSEADQLLEAIDEALAHRPSRAACRSRSTTSRPRGSATGTRRRRRSRRSTRRAPRGQDVHGRHVSLRRRRHRPRRVPAALGVRRRQAARQPARPDDAREDPRRDACSESREWENLCQLATPEACWSSGFAKAENKALRGASGSSRDRARRGQGLARRRDRPDCRRRTAASARSTS